MNGPRIIGRRISFSDGGWVVVMLTGVPVLCKIKNEVSNELARAMVGDLASTLHSANFEAGWPIDAEAIADLVQCSLHDTFIRSNREESWMLCFHRSRSAIDVKMYFPVGMGRGFPRETSLILMCKP